MAIDLKFINRSSALGGCDVVLFQKNLVADLRELAMAWKVIRHCGVSCHHPFQYATEVEVSVRDANGNHSPHVAVRDGQRLAATPTPYGRHLGARGRAVSYSQFEVVNELPRGAVDVNVYRSGLVVASKTAVAPEQKAVFQFKPALWIGAAAPTHQGERLTSAVMNGVDTELSLLGVASANIVMTGGGPGQQAKPFAFHLEELVAA
jgi:hypothetical protein